MRIPRIFTDQLLCEGQEIILHQQAARHLVSALRLSTGDHLTLFNGTGGEYSAHLVTVGSKKVTALLEAFSPGIAPSPLALTLAIGLSRGDRMDWVMQKAVELGVTTITPLFTERSEVKLKADRAVKKTAHWQEIARSACEQSGQNQVPEIHQPTTLQAALQLTELTDIACKMILDPLAKSSLVEQIAAQPRPSPQSVLLLSGPEGGFSGSEIAFAQSKSVLPVSIGPRILRTETAPIAALSVLQAHWGDWH